MTQKPKEVKILPAFGASMIISTGKIPKGLRKEVKIPHRCGELYKGDNFYGYYRYNY